MNFTERFLASTVEARRQSLNASTHVATLVFTSQRKEGAKLGDIARLLKTSPASITHIADTLEAMGLVSRVRRPGDRRTWLLAITPKGREALEMILNPKQQ